MRRHSYIYPLTIMTTISAILINGVEGGPAAYGICQAGCAAVVTACYAAAGFTFGVPIPGSTPAAIIACNSAFGTCQAACVAAGAAPIP